jgi:hypothetical protein
VRRLFDEQPAIVVAAIGLMATVVLATAWQLIPYVPGLVRWLWDKVVA